MGSAPPGHWKSLCITHLATCPNQNSPTDSADEAKRPWLRSIAKYAVVAPVLDERSRRRWAAAESRAIGYGGAAVVSSATGLARETIRKGRREIARDEAPTDRIPLADGRA